jgi:hypothetical protein
VAKPSETRRNTKSTKSASRQPGIIEKAVDAAYKKAGPGAQAAAVLVGPTPTPSPDFDK